MYYLLFPTFGRSKAHCAVYGPSFEDSVINGVLRSFSSLGSALDVTTKPIPVLSSGVCLFGFEASVVFPFRGGADVWWGRSTSKLGDFCAEGADFLRGFCFSYRHVSLRLVY